MKKGNAVSHLRIRPTTDTGLIADITPESAGWRYVGFALHRLKAGETVAAETGDREICLVLVTGKAWRPCAHACSHALTVALPC